MSDKKISFVIPCYRSEETLGAVVDEIIATMTPYGASYEIILVNDCSPDGTLDVIRGLVKRHKFITGVNFTKNFGQQAAIMAGLGLAGGDVAVCLDDDGQSPVDAFPALIDKLNEGYDIVYADYDKKKRGYLAAVGQPHDRPYYGVFTEQAQGLGGKQRFCLHKDYC